MSEFLGNGVKKGTWEAMLWEELLSAVCDAGILMVYRNRDVQSGNQCVGVIYRNKIESNSSSQYLKISINGAATGVGRASRVYLISISLLSNLLSS